MSKILNKMLSEVAVSYLKQNGYSLVRNEFGKMTSTADICAGDGAVKLKKDFFSFDWPLKNSAAPGTAEKLSGDIAQDSRNSRLSGIGRCDSVFSFDYSNKWKQRGICFLNANVSYNVECKVLMQGGKIYAAEGEKTTLATVENHESAFGLYFIIKNMFDKRAEAISGNENSPVFNREPPVISKEVPAFGKQVPVSRTDEQAPAQKAMSQIIIPAGMDYNAN
jgi:hypothetical protein